MNSKRDPSSYHSAIMSDRANHRYATAMNVAIGQGEAMDNPEWAALLKTIANWRNSLKKVKDNGKTKYAELIPCMAALVKATCEYY